MSAGTKSVETVSLGSLPSGTHLSTEVYRYRGAEDGPTVYVQAAQHGSEVNGVEVVRRLDALLDPADLAGTVVAVPMASPVSFDAVTHDAPRWFDDVHGNMNRSWPGDADGTLGQRMTAALWEYARDADAIVDLHCSMRESLPHVIYRGDDASRELAEAFGSHYLWALAGSREIDEYDREDVDRFHHLRKLTSVGVLEGIPSITPELGGHTDIDNDAVEVGVTGVRNVLRSVGVLDGSVVENGPAIAEFDRFGARADASGLFRPEPGVAVGDDVAAGDAIGQVYDPKTFDVDQTVTAERNGTLVSLKRKASTRAGDALYAALDRSV